MQALFYYPLWWRVLISMLQAALDKRSGVHSPKINAVLAAILVAGPWILSLLVHYAITSCWRSWMIS